MEFVREKLSELEEKERIIGDILCEKKITRTNNVIKQRNLNFILKGVLDSYEGKVNRLLSNELTVHNEIERIKERKEEYFYTELNKLDHSLTIDSDNIQNDDLHISLPSFFSSKNLPKWSGNERFGNYLDLYSVYNQFLNIGTNCKLSYLEYIGNIGKNFTDLVPLKNKTTKEYKVYLLSLCSYLESFWKRAQALVPINFDISEFERKWALGTVPGWERSVGTNIDVTHELLVRGFKAGGTETERFERLQLVLNQSDKNNMTDSHLQKKLKKSKLFNSKEIAMLEQKAQYLLFKLDDFREATRQFVTRKQVMTQQELELDEKEALNRIQAMNDADKLYSDHDNETDDQDNFLKSSKPILMDEDGQPLPLWLYKLRGLNQEYNCEICGDFVYRGKRAFEKHFQGVRHAQAMQLIGIPNTKHFKFITKINEATVLYEKLKKSIEPHNPDNIIQTEDLEGNVYSKKDYLDLQRSGYL